MKLQLGNGFEAQVDPEDYPLVADRVWIAARRRNTWYALSNRPYGQLHAVLMHRLILGSLVHGKKIDHVNGDGLDNRRENLRIATTQQNAQNGCRHSHWMSAYKGVRITRKGRFQARITVNSRQVILGRFDTQEEAVRAYDEAALAYFGPFARTNMPRERV